MLVTHQQIYEAVKELAACINSEDFDLTYTGDNELVVAIFENDKLAYQSCQYKNHAYAVHNIAHQMIRDANLSEDQFNEILERQYQADPLN